MLTMLDCKVKKEKVLKQAHVMIFTLGSKALPF